jgi:hypothetical protein
VPETLSRRVMGLPSWFVVRFPHLVVRQKSIVRARERLDRLHEKRSIFLAISHRRFSSSPSRHQILCPAIRRQLPSSKAIGSLLP